MRNSISGIVRGGMALLVLGSFVACSSEQITSAPVVAGTPADTTVVDSTSSAVALRGNEPSGFLKLADNDWLGFSPSAPALGKTLLSWTRYAKGNTGRAVVDALAPGDPDALEVLFSGKQGVGPEHMSVTIPKGNSRLYLSVPVWVPTTYVGSSSGVQKLFHLWAPIDKSINSTIGGSMVVPAIFGTLSKGLRAQLRIQNATVTSTQVTSFNLTGGSVQRGQWYVYEYLFVLNTGSTANGEAHLWVNGVKAVTKTNITYSGATRAKTWTVLQLNPTYGGTGTVPTGTKIRYGRIYLSVAP